MTVIESKVDVRSAEFKANEAVMRRAVDELRMRVATVRQGGGDAARARHVSRGKLLPRDRVDLLLDTGSPFLELSPLAAWDMYDNASPGAGIITGIGRIEGRECFGNGVAP